MTTREDLSNELDELGDKIQELEDELEEYHQKLGDIITQAVKGDRDQKGYVTTKLYIAMLDEMLDELRIQHDAANLALWQFDLQAQKDEVSKAIQAATDARLEVLTCQADKTNYLRAAGGDTPEDKNNKIANFDILMVDARSRAHTAEVHRNKMKEYLEALRRDYNELASTMSGWPLEPEKIAPGSVRSI